MKYLTTLVIALTLTACASGGQVQYESSAANGPQRVEQQSRYAEGTREIRVDRDSYGKRTSLIEGGWSSEQFDRYTDDFNSASASSNSDNQEPQKSERRVRKPAQRNYWF